MVLQLNQQLWRHQHAYTPQALIFYRKHEAPAMEMQPLNKKATEEEIYTHDRPVCVRLSLNVTFVINK